MIFLFHWFYSFDFQAILFHVSFKWAFLPKEHLAWMAGLNLGWTGYKYKYPNYYQLEYYSLVLIYLLLCTPLKIKNFSTIFLHLLLRNIAACSYYSIPLSISRLLSTWSLTRLLKIRERNLFEKVMAILPNCFSVEKTFDRGWSPIKKVYISE